MPDRETALFIALFLALGWIVWMDARPSAKAYFGRKAPLRIEPAAGSRGVIGTYCISVTNTSSVDIENVSIYPKGIHHAGILRPALRPGAEGYLLFDGDKETVTLRPGEMAFAPYMKDIVVGGEEVEFGPFKGREPSLSGKHKYKALMIEFTAYSKAFPPRHQSTWIRREPAGNGGVYTSGIGRPSYADLGYPESIQALKKKPRRKLPAR